MTDRMKTIVDMTPTCETAAEIGADHALISIHLARSGKAQTVYACDINEKPLATAKDNIRRFGVADRVIPLLSDGLCAVRGKTDTVILAGMGGELIADILFKEPLTGIKTLILQPMSRADALRRALTELGFFIADERLVKDGERIYCVILAHPGTADYTPEELAAGPWILKRRGPFFAPFLRRLITYEEHKAHGENGAYHALVAERLAAYRKEEDE